MELPSFLHFNRVPLRAQHNGWTADRQRRFVLALARGQGPDAPARAIGMTRQSAYRLRAKAGAEGFATAWDRRWLSHGRPRPPARLRRSPRPASLPLAPACIESLFIPRFYRGRLIGFDQREDVRGAMRTLAALVITDRGRDGA